MKPCIVMQTDFGLSTGLPISMNAVIDKIDPEIKIYDLCHEVREFDIRQASAYLASTFPYWRDGTIFVTVVDPGVGTDRRSCVALTDNGSFIVTPDNGSLTLLKDRIVAVREIDETVNRLPGSDDHHTFHGRDVYAYTAARLASGIITYEQVGKEYPVEEIVTFPLPEAKIVDGVATGEVTNASDHFGNVGISIPNEMIKQIGINVGDMARVIITKDDKVLYDETMLFHKSFGYVEKGKPILNECSNDYVEISINQGSFCEQCLPELLEAYDLSPYKVRIMPAGGDI
ncbi:MAG: SAM-dependent chlorinase/fluorinase [Erysipelotrichaceae bacterium]|nr:SAM-dependent chlorinase/fluorinase [Erysipelotrichaceae bacterium]